LLPLQNQKARKRNLPGLLRSLEKKKSAITMSTEAKKREVIAAIEQLEDEFALDQIQWLLARNPSPKPVAPPGFSQGGVLWMSEDFDEPLEDSKDYMY
jgi:hypothetical protein